MGRGLLPVQSRLFAIDRIFPVWRFDAECCAGVASAMSFLTHSTLLLAVAVDPLFVAHDEYVQVKMKGAARLPRSLFC